MSKADNPSNKNNQSDPKSPDNVVDIFTRRKVKDPENNPIVRLAPELDGIEMLYSNDVNKEKMFSMKILCWALRRNGEVEAMVPWLSRLVSAANLKDPLNGHWEGYYDSRHERLFYEAPVHKIVELEGAASYFHEIEEKAEESTVIQEIPDNIGTHAVMTSNSFQSVTLTQITSWRLFADGQIKAMIADTEKIDATPVLAGDECLYPIQEKPEFKYFFHHIIANKIKAGDPEAMAAFSRLLDQ
ncbi:hypothetical protein [Parendozoicomonas haliclonae]|uniref:Uncharacterized protein n=1 Tax=Parendozoicomonas haliclonae TaxID=1960125 RepID=A0A1X7AHS5_9GAMM|nr:hypothetical protein [Parendozoicomonas haliclonae]SMA43501.1 hypothetical protein EHSB41UT_01607 [Parendozoicomonas haliclonae]